MARTKDVLNQVAVEVAGGARKCAHNRKAHSIGKGVACLIVKLPSLGRNNYCAECALPMIELAEARLDEFRRDLGLPARATSGPGETLA